MTRAQSDANAQSRMGFMLMKGLGVNEDMAMQWLQLAAEAGLCVAQLLLRECRRQAAASLADAAAAAAAAATAAAAAAAAAASAAAAAANLARMLGTRS